MGRPLWVATCPFGWGLGSTEEQAVGQMCRGFSGLHREAAGEEVDVWLFKVRGYDRVGPGWIESDELEEAVCFRGTSTEQLGEIREAWDELYGAVDLALSKADRREEQQNGA